MRRQVSQGVADATAIPAALLTGWTSTGSGALRESWRQFVNGPIDALCRRLEAQLGAQVTISSAPLAGRGLLARAAAVKRLTNAGVSVADARQAIGI